MALPLKLAISFLIIGLMLPTVIAMTDSADERADIMVVRSVADDLADTMTACYYNGIGSGRTVTVTIPSGYSLELGGEGSSAYVMRILNDGEVVDNVYLDSPGFPVIGDTVRLSGTVVLDVSAVTSDDVLGVEVRI